MPGGPCDGTTAVTDAEGAYRYCNVLLLTLSPSWQLTSTVTKPHALDTGVMQTIIVEVFHRAKLLPLPVDPNPQCSLLAIKPDPIIVTSIPPDNGPREGMIASRVGHSSVTCAAADASSENERSFDDKRADTPDAEEQPKATLQTETDRFP
jgi:hypothetical protein